MRGHDGFGVLSAHPTCGEFKRIFPRSSAHPRPIRLSSDRPNRLVPISSGSTVAFSSLCVPSPAVPCRQSGAGLSTPIAW